MTHIREASAELRRGPSFVVVGAPRCGTTSLHHYLGQHPEIFMCPKKEPNYFAFYGKPPNIRGPVRWIHDEAVFSRTAYQALFLGSDPAKAIGEVSPRYLSHPDCAARIRRDVPDARIIAVLRQPAERAFASFVGLRRNGWEPCVDFAAAVRDQPRRRSEGWDSGCLLDRGLYCDNLERYYEAFGHDRIRVALYDDLQADAIGLLRGFFDFLDVDTSFVPDVATVHNRSGLIRNPWIAALWRHSYRQRRALQRVLPQKLAKRAEAWLQNNSEKPRLEPQLRAEVTAYFRADILKLQNLIQRDLSHWID